MDTKWKRFKYSTATKVIATILAIISAVSLSLLSGYFVLVYKEINGGDFYQGSTAHPTVRDSISDSQTYGGNIELTNFLTTDAPSVLLANDLTRIMQKSMYYPNNAYIESKEAVKPFESGLIKQRDAAIAEETDFLTFFYCAAREHIELNGAKHGFDSLGMLAYSDFRGRIGFDLNPSFRSDYFQKPGSVTSGYDEISTALDYSHEFVSKLANLKYIKGEYSADDAKKLLSEDAYKGFEKALANMKNVYTEKFKTDINALYFNYSKGLDSLERAFEKESGLKYIAYNRKTGDVFSNIGVTDYASFTSYKSTMQFWFTNVNSLGKIVSSFFVLSDDSDWNYKQFIEFSNTVPHTDDVEIYAGFENINSISGPYYDLYNNYQYYVYNTVPYAFIFSFLLVLLALCLVYLTRSAGRRAGTNEIKLRKIDKIPNDIRTLTLIGLGAFLLSLLFSIYLNTTLTFSSLTENCPPFANARSVYPAMGGTFRISFVIQSLLLPITALAGSGAALLVSWLTGVGRNVKKRMYFKNTVIYKSSSAIKRFFLRLFSPFKVLIKPEKFHRRTLLYFLFYITANIGVAALMLSLALFNYSPFSVLLGLSILAVINFFAMRHYFSIAKGLEGLMTAVDSVQDGDYTVNFSAESLPPTLREFGKNIASIQEGLEVAVDEAVRGEMLKTQLITNVSHDLKTPLTSIINYVDLLKRCDINDPKAQEYIEVLTDKSQRLKLLIEDLVEASKATTGNVQMNPIKLDLHELLIQCIGESEDLFEQSDLFLRLTTDDVHPIVFADSQKTWRIVDNLLSNARKYSLPGSRVFIDLFATEEFGGFVIRSTSAKELSASPKDLLQRFVRDDDSRSTEGSGLGLSITESLTQLQGGSFSIEIDGDLFKATVQLPLLSDELGLQEQIEVHVKKPAVQSEPISYSPLPFDEPQSILEKGISRYHAFREKTASQKRQRLDEKKNKASKEPQSETAVEPKNETSKEPKNETAVEPKSDTPKTNKKE